jgi:hypothetical protein
MVPDTIAALSGLLEKICRFLSIRIARYPPAVV